MERFTAGLRALEDLIERGDVRFEDDNRWRRYWAMP